MFKNKVKLLKKENDSIARWLKEEDGDIIDNIMESLGMFRVNSFDAQVIYRDLIGMAEEARLRGSTMKEVIGDDLRLTTYDIIRNSRGPNKGEIILQYLKYLSGLALLLEGFFGIIISRRFFWNVNIIGLLSLVLSISMLFLLSKMVRPLLNMEGWGRFGFYWTMLNALSLGTSATYSAYYGLDNQRFIIPSWFVLLGFGLLYLIAEYFHVKTIDELSRGNSNYFEELIDDN